MQKMANNGKIASQIFHSTGGTVAAGSIESIIRVFIQGHVDSTVDSQQPSGPSVE